MDKDVVEQLINARWVANGPDGPDKQNARVQFHTLLWQHWDEIVKVLQKRDQHVLKDEGEEHDD